MKLIPEYKCLNCGKTKEGESIITSDIPQTEKAIEDTAMWYSRKMKQNQENFICKCDEKHIGVMYFVGFIKQE